MNQKLLQAILLNIVIPEVAALFRRSPGLTDAEVIAEVNARVDRVIAVGEAWLRDKGVEVGPAGLGGVIDNGPTDG